MRMLRFLAVLASLVCMLVCVLVFVALPAMTAIAQEAAPPVSITITDPTGGLLGAIPGGIYVYALLVAIAGLISVFVKDSSLPPLVAKVLNFFALNVGKAKNDPEAN